MNRLRLKKLTVSGPGQKDSVIEFGPGLNLIIGPSNTGKSMVMDCIDYMFGFQPRKDKPSKIVDNKNGYDYITLDLMTATGTITLKRKIGDTKVQVISSADSNVLPGSYPINSSKNKPTIGSLLLSLIGITEPHEILASKEGKTVSLTWRSILHLFLLKQADIPREKSALESPHGFGSSSKAALYFLLTGNDAADITKPESKEITQAKKKAILNYIRDRRSLVLQQIAKLEDIKEQTDQIDLQEKIKMLRRQIKELKESLSDAASHSHSLMEQIYAKNGKLSECKTIIHNFKVLEKQYHTDIHRLDFVVDGKINVTATPVKTICPFCHSEVIEKPDTPSLDALAAELEKTKANLIGLKVAQNDIDQQRIQLEKELQLLYQQKETFDSQIKDKLEPELRNFQEELKQYIAMTRVNDKIQYLTTTKEEYDKDIFEKENEEETKNPTYDIKKYFDYDLIEKFQDMLIEILKASKFGGAASARFDINSFDIEIDNKHKASSMGGGYCALLNTITALAMTGYIIKRGRPAPGFFIADSPLTQLSEPGNLQAVETIKTNFLNYLLDHASERQIIIMEQKEKIPFPSKLTQNSKLTIIEFTRNKTQGRYGLLNDVYNPED